MTKLYILEGADGTGKTTLSQEILAQTKGHLLHCTWKKEWDIKEYFHQIHEAALVLLQYQDVVLDRWAVSDYVYANAYRGGATFEPDDFMLNTMGIATAVDKTMTRFIYCSNDKAVENHKENMKIREEMFDDMSPVVREYEKYMSETKLDWTRYDFTKVDMKEFVGELIK